MPNIVYTNIGNMYFGSRIRELRETKGLVLRKLAIALDIDTATMSKIEKGYRQAKSTHIPKLAEILSTDENELKILLPADKVINILGEDQENFIKIIKKVEEIILEKRNAS